jgi:hypothetical protein
MCSNDREGNVKKNSTVWVQQSIMRTNLLFMPCNDVASFEYKISLSQIVSCKR